MLSLLRSNKFSNRTDTVKARLLIEIAWEYSGIDPEESRRYAVQALSLSQQLNWGRGLARSYGAIGDYYFDKSELDEALRYYALDCEAAKKCGFKSSFFCPIWLK